MTRALINTEVFLGESDDEGEPHREDESRQTR